MKWIKNVLKNWYDKDQSNKMVEFVLIYNLSFGIISMRIYKKLITPKAYCQAHKFTPFIFPYALLVTFVLRLPSSIYLHSLSGAI